MKNADLVIVSVPVGSSGDVARQIRRLAEARRDRDRCRFNQGFGDCADAAGTPRECAFHSRTSAGRNGIFRPRCRVCRSVHHTVGAFSRRHSMARTRTLGREADKVLGSLRFAARARWTLCRDRVLAIVSHLPHLIAYNIVGTASDLEEVTELRSHQIFGFRFSRFHPSGRI